MLVLVPLFGAAAVAADSPEAVPQAAAALAADAADIVVTGERVSRSITDTQASVAVFTGEDLRDQPGSSRLEDILVQVPNLQIGSGDQGPTIRGQDSTGVLLGADAFLGGSRPRTTIQIDGRAIGYNEFIYGLTSLWDVSQVEVFRTPQTTTQGRNSIAGAIFIRTEDPTFTPEGRARILLSNYRTRQASLAASAPLIDDQLAVRLAVDGRRHRSWVKYDEELVEDADIRRDDHLVARAKLLATPTALPGSRLLLTYTHLTSRGPQGEVIDTPPLKERRAIGDGGYWKTNVDSLTAQGSAPLTTGVELDATFAQGWSVIRRFSPPGQGRAKVDATDTSLEAIVRAGGEKDRLSGILGASGFWSKQNEVIDLSAFIGLGDFHDEQTSLGVFGEASFRPLPRLTLTGGLRYQHDHQDRDGFLGTDAFGFGVDYDRSFEAWLPKASASYELSDATTVGVLVQRAYNPGGTTISFETGKQDTFEAESLWNQELFLRTSLLDQRLRLGANLFWTRFKNAQRPVTFIVQTPSGPVVDGEIDNVPQARSIGAEIEADWRPTRQLSVRAAIGLLDTKLQRSLDPLDPIVGKDFQRAPHFTGALGVAWRPIEGLELGGQLLHNSRYFSDDANTRALRIGASTTVNARAAYTWHGVTASAYVRNALDEFAMTQLYAPDFGSANDPREYGLELEARF